LILTNSCDTLGGWRRKRRERDTTEANQRLFFVRFCVRGFLPAEYQLN
jgi:hypothetical protein